MKSNLSIDQQLRDLRNKLCLASKQITTEMVLQIEVAITADPNGNIYIPENTTQFILNVNGIISPNVKIDSVSVILDNGTLPRDLTDRKSYKVTYALDKTIVKFTQPTQLLQLYIIRYEYIPNS